MIPELSTVDNNTNAVSKKIPTGRETVYERDPDSCQDKTIE